MRGLDILTADPPNAGVSLDRLDGSVADQASMYMRNNFPIPGAAPDHFEVVMPGESPRPVTVADLAGLEKVEDRIVLECAGNGRTLMDPVPEGTPWGLGGASLIEVRGVRLAEVLGAVPDGVTEIVLTGADSGRVDPEGEVNYQFSLPLPLAVSDDALVVTHIGGEPLTLEHGAPARVVVRGHYAMMSVKWLTRIEGIEGVFHGHFVEKYRYFGDDEAPEGDRVAGMRPRAVIASHLEGDTVAAGPLRVSGSAWTGTGEIVEVVVSAGEGVAAEAELERVGRGAVRWAAHLDVGPGPVRLVAGATDSTGASQPERPRWNRNGYANNVRHSVGVTVT